MRTLLLALLPSIALATPVQMAYQGRVLDPAGEPANGANDVTVRLYDDGGNILFTEVFTDVVLQDGFFAVSLGEDTAGNALDHLVVGSADSAGVQINAAAELLPRHQLVATFSAAHANVADHATTADDATNAEVAAHAITADLATDATNAEISLEALHADTAASADLATNSGLFAGQMPSYFAAPGTLDIQLHSCAWTGCRDTPLAQSTAQNNCPANKVLRAIDVATHPDQKPAGCTSTNHEDEIRYYCCSMRVVVPTR